MFYHADDDHKKDDVNKYKPLLTRRETDIIILICKEYSNKQIAAELRLSPYTVEDHKKSIRRKTKSLTVVGVALYAAKNQIITQIIFFIFSAFSDGNPFEMLLPDLAWTKITNPTNLKKE